MIAQYSYIYEGQKSNYRVYSAYYSEYYATIYISYDSISNPSQTLKAADLYEIERHSLYYFQTDNNKTDYKNYIKAVLIYPDTLASACRENKDDNSAFYINGCANYVGKEAIISINRFASLEHFYEGRKEYMTQTKYLNIEPMRYTFAHEFGHVSTFFNMSYKNDEDYEDYLKLRLGSLYNTIYPHGLPSSYSSQDDGYYTQPTEILADDYVELFYDTSKKVEEDTREYTLNHGYDRNSLRDYESIKQLSSNLNLYNQIKEYYTNNFLDYTQKLTYDKPKVISSSYNTIEYYESYSEIGNTSLLKTKNSLIDINLIAVGEVLVDQTKYYRVILSNTFDTSSGSYDEKEVGKKMGYVKASEYTINNDIKIYAINYNRSESSPMGKNNMAPIEDINNTFILPYYDFSYVLNTTTSNNYATMYDYLNNKIENQQYQVNIYSFGTLIN